MRAKRPSGLDKPNKKAISRATTKRQVQKNHEKVFHLNMITESVYQIKKGWIYMNIPGLDLMSDDEFGKLLKTMSGEKDKNKEPRWAEHKNNETTASNVNTGYITSRPVPSVQMANGKMQRRTEKTLMKAAIERGLHIGTKARIERRSIGKDGSWILREVEEGTVTEICDHFFMVQIGNHRECFSWNEWAGDDHTKVRFRK